VVSHLGTRRVALAACSGLVLLLSALTVAFAGAMPARAADTPAWWSGVCDVGNNPGSNALAASYNGVQACGPGPEQGGADHEVQFYKGAWGEYEWECVELAMRYMYLIYGIAPYSANGNTVVSNYSGSVLTKVQNDTGSVPTPGDILSFAANSFGHGTTGHTAVVTGVNTTTDQVTIM
jgi:hypothetical protein